jgi:cephalosporin-C deacetylase-like acetyl esterase
MREMAARTASAIPEWQAALDAVLTLACVDGERVGYWGLSMGTSIGVPFVAAESRVKAAVLGLNGLWPGQDAFEKAARSISIPLLFVFQWDDELMSRESGLALFDAIGSAEKTMHINPGGHVGTPLFERDDYDAFFARHLGT